MLGSGIFGGERGQRKLGTAGDKYELQSYHMAVSGRRYATI
jgi:hypothetical protein